MTFHRTDATAEILHRYRDDCGSYCTFPHRRQRDAALGATLARHELAFWATLNDETDPKGYQRSNALRAAVSRQRQAAGAYAQVREIMADERARQAVDQ